MNNRKLPFQSPPPNKILYQDDYSSPQLVFLPQTPDSSSSAGQQIFNATTNVNNNNSQRPLRYANFDDNISDEPLTPIVSSMDKEESIWNHGGNDSTYKKKSPERNNDLLTPISNVDSLNQSSLSNDHFEDSFQHLEKSQQGERVDLNSKISLKKNKKNKMIRMVDDDEDEYDDPFAHVPEITINNNEDVTICVSETSTEPQQVQSNVITSSNTRITSPRPTLKSNSSSSLDRSKPPQVEEYVFERASLDGLPNNEFQQGENVEMMDRKKMLSDKRGNMSAAMNGILEKLSSFKLNSPATLVEASSLNDLEVAQPSVASVAADDDEEEDGFLNDIITSHDPHNTSYNQQPYLPNANAQPTPSSSAANNTSFMAQSWAEKLKKIDVSAGVAHEFFVSCQETDLDGVKSYLEEKNLDVNTKDLVGYGQTALHYACWNGSLKLVEYLLSKEACVNVTNDYNQTPLHEAAFRGHPDIVTLLLKSGADKSCTDHVGETALDYAKKKRNEATNFTSESLYKDVIKVLDSHTMMVDKNQSNPGHPGRRNRRTICCFQ